MKTNYLVMFVSIALTLMLAEAMVRILNLVPSTQKIWLSHSSSVFLGSEYKCTEYTNSHGTRNYYNSKVSTKKRKIIFLGDSLTYGSGVSNHETFSYRVENILGLAATTHDVDNWIWDKSYTQYIENNEIRDLLIENNRFAMMDIIKNMIQADKRGYWDAKEEQIENLKKLCLEIENWIEKIY